MLRLRSYKKCDEQYIVSWVKNEVKESMKERFSPGEELTMIMRNI